MNEQHYRFFDLFVYFMFLLQEFLFFVVMVISI